MRLTYITTAFAVVGIAISTFIVVISQREASLSTKCVYSRWFGKGERMRPAKRLK